MVNSIDDIKRIINDDRDVLNSRYPIKSLGVFGSYARGEQTKGSDIDILIEFSRPIGLLAFIRLENELKSLLGAKVDLVTKKALKPRIGKHILKEVVRI